MELLLQRHLFTETQTIGDLYIDGQFFCNTLEDCDRKLESGGEKIYGKTCIPRGAYRVKWTYSNKYKKMMPEILDVPQFLGVRIHAGNTEVDTLGCILVGVYKYQERRLVNSRVTRDALYALLEDVEIINITII